MGRQESLNFSIENGKIYGFRFAPSFSGLINEAASKVRMSRANFVRSAIANAISAVERGEFSADENVCRRQGQQTAPKNEVLARAAGARAVRNSKKPGTPENARRLELLELGYDEEAVVEHIYAEARAKKLEVCTIAPEKDKKFISLDVERSEELECQ